MTLLCNHVDNNNVMGTVQRFPDSLESCPDNEAKGLVLVLGNGVVSTTPAQPEPGVVPGPITGVRGQVLESSWLVAL